MTFEELATALDAFHNGAMTSARSTEDSQVISMAASIVSGVNAIAHAMREQHTQRIATLTDVALAIGEIYPASTTRHKLDLARHLLENFNITRR